MRLPRIAAVVAVYLLAASAGQAADVAILKSSDVPAWRPVLDGLRKVLHFLLLAFIFAALIVASSTRLPILPRASSFSRPA